MQKVIQINDYSANKKLRPKGHMKIDYNSLSSLPTFDSPNIPEVREEGIYRFKMDRFEHDLLYKPSTEKRLFIFFIGAVNREKYTPPVFQRWSWASLFPGHCLYISDPTLKLSETLGLSWYLGTKDAYLIPDIAVIIKNVAQNIGVPMENVILYGSSGGGFAALQLSTLLPEVTSIVINPQVDITKYKRNNVAAYLKRVFDGLSIEDVKKEYIYKFSVIPHSDQLLNNKILYVQNRMDEHHYSIHLALFAEVFGLNKVNNYKKNNMEVIFFDHPNGHGEPEPSEVIEYLLKRVVKLTSN